MRKLKVLMLSAVAILASIPGFAQVSVRGVVTSEDDGLPVIGAYIVEKGTLKMRRSLTWTESSSSMSPHPERLSLCPVLDTLSRKSLPKPVSRSCSSQTPRCSLRWSSPVCSRWTSVCSPVPPQRFRLTRPRSAVFPPDICSVRLRTKACSCIFP